MTQETAIKLFEERKVRTVWDKEKEEWYFSMLTDIITKTWSGKTTKEYKQYKGLKKESLRDNMTNTELVLNMLAKLSTKQISETSNPETFADSAQAVVLNAKLDMMVGKRENDDSQS